MADEQFGHLEQWHQTKHKHALYLNEKLAKFSQLELPIPRTGDEPSWYAYTFRIKEGVLRISTNEFCEKLVEAGVADADMPGSTCPLNLLPLFQRPAVLFPHYKDKVAYNVGDFPVAESFFARAIKLPIDIYETSEYQNVLDSYIETIGSLLKEYTN